MWRIVYFSLGVLSVFLVPFALKNTDAKTPSAVNVKGTCIWQEVKYPTTSGEAADVGPATIVASLNFDGNGGIMMDYDVNIDGTYTSTNGVPGSYSVDPTGHGTFTFMSPASNIIRTYDFRVSPNGHSIYTIAQSDGGFAVTQRVSFGTCSFQN